MGGISAWVPEFLRRTAGYSVSGASQAVGAITVVTGIRGTLAGGWIDPDLVQRVLNDTNDDPAHLPSLQYAMMRCWERAYRRSKLENGRRPHLTMVDYAKIGGVLGIDCAA